MTLFRLKYIALVLAACVSGSVLAEQSFYVYRDHGGRQHMGDTVPGEFVRYGYRIVNGRGVTIETVAPQQARPATVATPSSAGLSDGDKTLLRTFHSEEDIEYSRQNKLTFLQQQINFTRNNLDLLRGNLQALDEHKKMHKPTEGDVFKHLHEQEADIEQVRNQIRENELRLKSQTDEIRRVNTQFDASLARFRKLKLAGN